MKERNAKALIIAILLFAVILIGFETNWLISGILIFICIDDIKDFLLEDSIK